MRPHVAALLLTCIHAFAPTPPPRAPRQTKVYVFDKLAESIKGATDLLSGKSRMTEANTKGALRDIRRALLDADVSKVVVDDLRRARDEKRARRRGDRGRRPLAAVREDRLR